ncbi:MAG: transcription termination factor Rho, partial [Planctomycetota bacterium]
LRMEEQLADRGPKDVIVPPALREQFQLRGGELIVGPVEEKPLRGADAAPRLMDIQSINGRTAREYARATKFEGLTAVEPYRQMGLEHDGGSLSNRILDIVAPLGFGAKGLLIAPERSGKTTMFRQIAQGIAANHSDVRMIALLIDERPEDVTDMERTIPGEVLASASDRGAREHVRLARFVFDRAKRLVELGEDVVVFVDSLTRLSRAYLACSGLDWSTDAIRDPALLEEPRSFFLSGRATDEGGSLTVLASVCSETESELDEFILSQYSGRGNMEVVLRGDVARAQVWPAIDLMQSTSATQAVMLTSDAFEAAAAIRREVEGEKPVPAVQRVIEIFEEQEDNASLIASF